MTIHTWLNHGGQGHRMLYYFSRPGRRRSIPRTTWSESREGQFSQETLEDWRVDAAQAAGLHTAIPDSAGWQQCSGFSLLPGSQASLIGGGRPVPPPTPQIPSRDLPSFLSRLFPSKHARSILQRIQPTARFQEKTDGPNYSVCFLMLLHSTMWALSEPQSHKSRVFVPHLGPTVVFCFSSSLGS